MIKVWSSTSGYRSRITWIRLSKLVKKWKTSGPPPLRTRFPKETCFLTDGSERTRMCQNEPDRKWDNGKNISLERVKHLQEPYRTFRDAPGRSRTCQNHQYHDRTKEKQNNTINTCNSWTFHGVPKTCYYYYHILYVFTDFEVFLHIITLAFPTYSHDGTDRHPTSSVGYMWGMWPVISHICIYCRSIVIYDIYCSDIFLLYI